MFDIMRQMTALSRIFKSPTYGETLEHYILTQKPQDVSEIEKLEAEWQRMQSRGWFNV
jgi:hypothetical protein